VMSPAWITASASAMASSTAEGTDDRSAVFRWVRLSEREQLLAHSPWST